MGIVLRPSNLDRRRRCPGSGAAEATAPPEAESEDAARGTRLHELLAGLLRKARHLGEVQTVQGQLQEGIEFKEMYQAAGKDAGEDARHLGWAWAHAAGLLAEHGDRAVLVEEPVTKELAGIHPQLTGGTVDLALVEPWGNAVIVDWKFGGGDVPAARRNWQLAAYAVALADRHELESVELQLVQPIRHRVDRATMSAASIDAARAAIRQVCDVALEDWAPRVPSKAACTYCSALTTCPAALALGEDLPDVDAPLGGAALAQLLPRAEVLARWAGRVKQQAYELALAGGRLPGYRMAETQRRAWNDKATPVAVSTALAAVGKDCTDVLKPAELRSPNQINERVGRSKAVGDALAPFIEHSTTYRLEEDPDHE